MIPKRINELRERASHFPKWKDDRGFVATVTECLDEIERLRRTLEAVAIDRFVDQGGPDSTQTTANGNVPMIWIGDMGFAVTCDETGRLQAREVP